jgi:hypothetical protein
MWILPQLCLIALIAAMFVYERRRAEKRVRDWLQALGLEHLAPPIWKNYRSQLSRIDQQGLVELQIGTEKDRCHLLAAIESDLERRGGDDRADAGVPVAKERLGWLLLVGLVGVLLIGHFHGELRVFLAGQPVIGSHYAEYHLHGQWESGRRRLKIERDFPAWNDCLFRLDWPGFLTARVSSGSCDASRDDDGLLWLQFEIVDADGFLESKERQISFAGRDSLWISASPNSELGYWFLRTFDK